MESWTESQVITPSCRAFLLLTLASTLLAGAPATAQPAGAGTRDPTRALTPPSSADAAVVGRDYLAAQRASLGLASDDLLELAVKSRAVVRRTGVTHLVLQQQIDGIDVFKASVTASVDASGRLLVLGDRLVRGLRPRTTERRARISPDRAVSSVAAHLGLEPEAPLASLRRPGGRSRAVVFAATGLSRDEIPVKLEFVETDDRVALAWNVVIRTPNGRHWWNIHVDASSGEVLRQDDWIDRETQRVYPQPLMSPDEGPRALVANQANPLASPEGWHDTDGIAGPEYTDTRGNNVFAQEDAEGDDTNGYRPDGGAGLDFDFPIDLSMQPGNYRDALITNLFYWNNYVHDVLYRRGFDESAGNFQLNNYGNGGLGADAVEADALDGSDINNAQFGTPPDGITPRMEMYRWRQGPTSLSVSTPLAVAGVYSAGQALFGAGTLGLPGTVVAALDPSDGDGPATTDACSPLTNAGAIAGNIAMIDRGDCTFVTKVGHAQDAGAIGAIVVNNVAAQIITMSGADPSITIPAVFLLESDGGAIRSQLGSGVTATLTSPADRASSLDNGVVVHEYAHGLSNRLTGGPDTVSCLDRPEANGMGEGWSDWLALVFTAMAEDEPTDLRGIGPYLLGTPPNSIGIRNYPYTTDFGSNPLTYADISFLNRPHGIGEVWAASLWEVYWNLVGVYGFDPDLAEGNRGNTIALELVIAAMKYQPCEPTFLDARDALLAADAAAYAAEHRCLLWAGFAKRGVGLSASDGGSASNLIVSEAFDIPAECVPSCGDGLLQIGEQCDDGNSDPDDFCSNSCEGIPVPEPAGLVTGAVGVVFLVGLGRWRRAGDRASRAGKAPRWIENRTPDRVER